MAIIPFEPFQQLSRFSREMEDFVTDFFGRGAGRGAGSWRPTCTVDERNDAYQLEVELPGVDEQDVEVSLQGRQMRIRGERKEERRMGEDAADRPGASGGGGERRTRFTGVYERSFTLPDDVDAERIEATFSSGLLRVRLPRRERSAEREARRIDVRKG